jgi:hypothetical protein
VRRGRFTRAVKSLTERGCLTGQSESGITMSEVLSRAERFTSAFRRLAESAEVLKAESNQFSKPIEQINATLRAVGVRLSTWHKVVGGEDDYNNYWTREVGFTSVRGLWGLVIRETTGNHALPDREESDFWPFDEAPPSYRIEALDKLPDLLEELIKNTDKTAKKLKETTVEVREMATALAEAAKEIKQQKGGK